MRRGDCPSIRFQGWTWFVMPTKSNPASSAAQAFRTRAGAPCSSVFSLYPISTMNGLPKADGPPGARTVS
jgi:hypothetical protein